MTDDGPDPFTNMFEAPAKFARALFAPMAEATTGSPLSAEDMRHWAEVGARLQAMWMEYQAEQLADPQKLVPWFDPSRWMRLAEDWYHQMPLGDPARQQALIQEGMALWQQVLGQYFFVHKIAIQMLYFQIKFLHIKFVVFVLKY